MSTDLAIRKTLPALVAAYKRSEVEIRQAYDLLESAEKRLLAEMDAMSPYIKHR